MVKGVSIKFSSYNETIPKVLNLIKFNNEIKKHSRIVIKPTLDVDPMKSTPLDMVGIVVAYCMHYKNPETEIIIADGVDGADTLELFDSQGFRQIAEKFGVGLVDLNETECEPLGNNEFVGFDRIMYPTILKDSFVISLPKLQKDEKVEMTGSFAGLLGAFPAKHYKGWFSQKKNKLDAYPLKYQIHDIATCKVPDFAIVDAVDQGLILAGRTLDMDKQGAKILGLDWRSIGYLRMIDDTLTAREKAEEEKNAKGNQ